jgi:hypothetical protein
MLSSLVLLLAQLAAPPMTPQSVHRNVYHGRENQLQVDLPRLEAAAKIDGTLNEPVWQSAALLTSFSQYQPVDGLAADDSTEVLVWYDQHALYVGVRAFEAHGTARATLADRDNTFSDDYVHLLLDTFHDARRALVFGANPLGIQTDGIYTEDATNNSLDTSPDYIYESRGHVTDYGYEIEMRIPFKSLRYQSKKVQDWGIQVIRQVQHSGHQLTWTPAKRGANSFLGQSGSLVGLTDLKRGLVMDVNPEATSKMTGLRTLSDTWRYDTQKPQVGGNLRWGISNSLTLNGTIKPDFSQIESDAGQVVSDPRNALFFPEKRPFFLDASEQFQVPNQLIYTRRVVQPVAATKLTGSLSGTNVGFMSAVDDQPFSSTGTDNPIFNILRVRRDIGAGSTGGIVYTDRIDGNNYNRVAGADTRIVFKRVYKVFLQGAESFTRRDGVATQAPLWDAYIDRGGRGFQFHNQLTGIHPAFRTASGFVGRGGIVHGVINPRYLHFGKPGEAIQFWQNGTVLDFTWDYNDFFAGKQVGDVKWHMNTFMTTSGGWNFGASTFIESFQYDPKLYSNYYITQAGPAGVDTVPFNSLKRGRIPNFDGFLSGTTPTYKRFDATGYIVFGRDENFYEWAPAFIIFAQPTIKWRPTDRMRLEASYIHQQFIRWEDGTTVGTQQIPRIKLEYQVKRPIFFRFIGEYSSDRRDALRDPLTGAPIFTASSNGFVRAGKQQTNGFRADWLFSYKPNPGTVVFLGYGSQLTDAAAFAFRDVRRSEDGFFVKLSYLFRM